MSTNLWFVCVPRMLRPPKVDGFVRPTVGILHMGRFLVHLEAAVVLVKGGEGGGGVIRWQMVGSCLGRGDWRPSHVATRGRFCSALVMPKYLFTHIHY
jgi:hypothetical protein